jgi:sporulation protein YlmC with PRC-barrel domain
VIRLSDLNDKRVRTLDGKSVGRVHDVHCKDGKVTALKVGAASFIERMTARTHGRRIPWENVVKIERDRIIVSDPPAGKKS